LEKAEFSVHRPFVSTDTVEELAIFGRRCIAYGRTSGMGTISANGKHCGVSAILSGQAAASG
jgi:hypothetical protein